VPCLPGFTAQWLPWTTHVDAVLNVGALVLLPREEPLVVCFVLGEKQRHIAFAGKDEFTQQRMRCRYRTRACGRFDLLEVWFFSGSVGLGNPFRPVVPEPECRQYMQFCRFRFPISCRNPAPGGPLGISLVVRVLKFTLVSASNFNPHWLSLPKGAALILLRLQVWRINRG
jgi:hypothetical protein